MDYNKFADGAVDDMPITAAEIRAQLENAGGTGGEIDGEGKVVLRRERGRTVWAQPFPDRWAIVEDGNVIATPPHTAREIARALWRAFTR